MRPISTKCTHVRVQAHVAGPTTIGFSSSFVCAAHSPYTSIFLLISLRRTPALFRFSSSCSLAYKQTHCETGAFKINIITLASYALLSELHLRLDPWRAVAFPRMRKARSLAESDANREKNIHSFFTVSYHRTRYSQHINFEPQADRTVNTAAAAGNEQESNSSSSGTSSKSIKQ